MMRTLQASPEAPLASESEAPPLTCFIVYAHVDYKHEKDPQKKQELEAKDKSVRAQVDTIIQCLKERNITVFSDRNSDNALRAIQDFNERIRLNHEYAVDFVLVLSTNELIQKYHASTPEVRYELDMVHDRMAIEDVIVDREKLDVDRSVIAILLEGTKEGLPEFMRDRKMVYVNCSYPTIPLEKSVQKAINAMDTSKHRSLERFREIKDLLKGKEITSRPIDVQSMIETIIKGLGTYKGPVNLQANESVNAQGRGTVVQDNTRTPTEKPETGWNIQLNARMDLRKGAIGQKNGPFRN